MAIPKYSNETCFDLGSDSDSDNYYVHMDLDTNESSSSDESNIQDLNNYMEIETCQNNNQFELIKSQTINECKDVRQYSFFTKYLPGLESLFETGGVYGAEHYIDKLKSN